MRPQTHVNYELNLMTMEGEEFTEEFSHCFDSELYDSDVDGTDIMMVNFKMDELRSKHGVLFLIDIIIDRGVVSH